MFAGALAVAAFTVVTPPPAGAATFGPVDASLADGAPNSLRDIIENQATNAGGDVVVLEAGATYTLTCSAGGQLSHGSTPLEIQGQGATITIEPTCLERILQQGDALLTLRDVTIRDAVAKGFDGGGINAQGDVVLERSRILDNSAGDTENGGSGGGIQANNITVVDSVISGNVAQRDGDGGGIRAFGDVTVIRSTISNNEARGYGGIYTLGQEATIVDSTLSGNCAEGTIGAARFNEAVIVNSTITGNRAIEIGGISANALDLTYSTVVGNVTDPGTDCARFEGSAGRPGPDGAPANISVGNTDEFRIFGSVIARAVGGPNCADTGLDPLTATVSYGRNYSDDSSCGLANVGAGDRENAADPALGALGSNGGPTATMVPAASSPLLDAIPAGACRTAPLASQVATDQRGVARPQGPGCDIGAVEVVPAAPPAPPLVVTPTFTG